MAISLKEVFSGRMVNGSTTPLCLMKDNQVICVCCYKDMVLWPSADASTDAVSFYNVCTKCSLYVCYLCTITSPCDNLNRLQCSDCYSENATMHSR